jgi:hypothetical protein
MGGGGAFLERRWLRHTRKRGEIPCVYSRALRGNDTMGFRPRCVLSVTPTLIDLVYRQERTQGGKILIVSLLRQQL